MLNTGTLVALIAAEDKKKFFFRLTPGANFGTHLGNIEHDKIMEKDYGSVIHTHIDKPFFIVRPSLFDIIMNIKRHTQIIYPKDIGYILLKLGLRNGDRVLEAGTGSAALSIAMGYAVAPEGKVYTYERRGEFADKARRNMEMAGISDFIESKVRDIGEDGFEETEVDAIFLDMKEPKAAIPHAYRALKNGGNLALLLPTMNQVSEVIKALEDEAFTFEDIEVVELLIRKYKINAERLRPEDKMVGHTGYLVFTRKELELKV